MKEELNEKILKYAKAFAEAHDFYLDLIGLPRSIGFDGKTIHIGINENEVRFDFVDGYEKLDLDFHDIKDCYKIMKCLRVMNKTDEKETKKEDKQSKTWLQNIFD